jgi:PIN like domain
VLFDNCTSPVFASTLNGYVEHLGHRAFHLRDEDPQGHKLGINRHSPDESWMNAIHQDGRVWIIITGDDRIRKNPLLRMALRKAEIRGFVLAAAYQKSPLNLTASMIVRKWPEMEQQMRLSQGAALFELTVNFKSGFKPLPF